MLGVKSLPRKGLGPSSRVLVPTSSVGLPVLVCYPSTTRSNYSCLAKPSRVDLARKSNDRTSGKSKRGLDVGSQACSTICAESGLGMNVGAMG